MIPPAPEVEIKPKVKLFSVLIDLEVCGDTTDCYESTWAREFLTFLGKIQKKGKRFLHLEIGDTFTMAITDDKEVFSWGLNDCG